MAVRQPIWLRRAAAPGAEAFAILFALESLARAILTTVLPLEALRLLGDAKGVSTLFFLGSISGLLGSLMIPWLVRHSSRRAVYSLGAALLMAAPVSLYAGGQAGLVGGLACRVLGVVTLTICVNLYIMDVIAKHELSRSEPMRLFYSAAAWIVGPALGVWLARSFGPWSAYVVSFSASATMLSYFWFLRLSDPPSIAVYPGRRRAPGPLANIGRFARQPRLLMAWTVSLGRYSWWAMFYIYMPIFAVGTGLGEQTAGLIISVANSALLLMPLWGRVMRRQGVRRMLMTGFAASATATFATGFCFSVPWLGAGLLIAGALAMIMLDAVGNMLFFTAVKPRERAAMTSVYSTFRDAGDLVTPGTFALLLRWLELPVVFLAGGIAMLGLSLLSRLINPRIGLPPRVRPEPLARDT